MTTAEIDHYRRRLLSLKRRLVGDLSKVEDEALRPLGDESGGGRSHVRTHLADPGAETSEKDVALELLEDDAETLREIDDALARIDRGNFGHCEDCRRDISEERLDALPYARRCVHCAQAQWAGAGTTVRA